MESGKDRRNDCRRDLAGFWTNRERHQPYVRSTLIPPPHHDEGPSRPRTETHRNERSMPPLLSTHNFCVSTSGIVYALKKLGPKVKWPQKIRSDPSTRKSNALCEFHQERGHKTEDCIALRQEVVNMLHQGHLKDLMSDCGRANFARGRERHQGPPKPPSPGRTIQMIIGGSDDASINNVKFTTTHKLKRSITHERRIMVDDGSGTCIIHPRVLTQMKLEDKIVPRCITLTGLNNAVKRTSGEITLVVLVGGVTLETTFHIMD
ncbi:PREDICTED: uncharacterized protein LOC109211691 [Nicotiana attenuata]|uniref:uncharacterized protein LOC109211691 n=1 Tax=Nicotiana attenuata TaxID=49451 RepID=UPI0009054092|nr:PREDICTED: uncharacterized protein LOC109211691 [Nicotiana attenuata]